MNVPLGLLIQDLYIIIFFENVLALGQVFSNCTEEVGLSIATLDYSFRAPIRDLYTTFSAVNHPIPSHPSLGWDDYIIIALRMVWMIIR
jgi:hypothetical protein